MTEHVTAHGYDGFVFLAGCICGWTGKRRSTFQVVVADEIAHKSHAGMNLLVVDTATSVA